LVMFVTEPQLVESDENCEPDDMEPELLPMPDVLPVLPVLEPEP